MRITAIDQHNDLFSVSDVLTDVLLQKLSQEPLSCMAYTKQEWQEDVPRRKLYQFPGSTLESIHEHINQQKHQIGDAIGQNIHSIDTAFWYDQEGFDFTAHIDNPGVDKVMQIYLSDCKGAGTVFYNIDDSEVIEYDDEQQYNYTGIHPPANVREQFEFETNTGYLMINHRRQLHGVPNKIGKHDTRLSVYCYLNTASDDHKTLTHRSV